MKELKTEILLMPGLGKAANWTDLFNLLYPKLSGFSLDDFVELKITSTNIQLTRVTNNERNN